MKSFLEPVDLELAHVRVIVQGMVHVAHADGAHERELVLIREFYESCRDDAKGLYDFSELARAPLDIEAAKDVLDTDQLKLTFLTSCYLVAYADGFVSDGEKTALAALVKQLGIDEAIAENARELVKDQLLQQLARSQNLEALKNIARSL